MTQDFIGVAGIFTLSIFIWILYHDRFRKWSISNETRETDLRLQINDEFKDSRCSYCGLLVTHQMKGASSISYCSISCRLAAYRRRLLVMGNIILLLPRHFKVFDLVILILGILLIVLGLRGMEMHYPRFRYRNLEQSNKNKSKLDLLSNVSDDDRESIDTITVNELGLTVRICCYQTARLNERYCGCGRAIPQQLIEFLHP